MNWDWWTFVIGIVTGWIIIVAIIFWAIGFALKDKNK